MIQVTNLSIPYSDITHSQHLPPSVQILEEGGTLFIASAILETCPRNGADPELACLLKESCSSTKSLCLTECCSDCVVRPRDTTKILRLEIWKRYWRRSGSSVRPFQVFIGMGVCRWVIHGQPAFR